MKSKVSKQFLFIKIDGKNRRIRIDVRRKRSIVTADMVKLAPKWVKDLMEKYADDGPIARWCRDED